MKIAKIQAQKFRKQFLTVSLDDGRSLKVHHEIAAKNTLAEGDSISEEQLKILQFESEKKEALEYGYVFLSYRGRSEKEMRDRLKRRGYSDTIAESVVQDLKQCSLLDDLSMAKNLAESRVKNRLWGTHKVQQDLVQKGIPPQIAAQAAETAESIALESDLSEDERAYQLVIKRKDQIHTDDPRALYRRLFGYLTRRGYDYDTVDRVMHRYRRSLTVKP